MRLFSQTFEEIKNAFLRTEKTKSLFHGSLASMVVWVVSLGIRLILGIMLARFLGVSNYGIYSYALAWLAFLTIPTALGLDQVALRYVSAYKETQVWSKLNGLLRFAFLTALSASVIVSIVSVSIIAFLPDISWDQRVSLWVMLAILPLAVLTQIRQSSLRGLDHPVLAQVPENIIYPVFLILILSGIHFFTGTIIKAPEAVAANLVAWAATFIIGTVLLFFKTPNVVRKSPAEYDKSVWMDMVLPLIFSGGAYYFMSRGDLLLLGVLGTNRDVGLYAASSRMAEQLVLPVYTVVTFAGASLFSAIYAKGDLIELQRFTRLSSRVILWGTIPIYLFLMIFSPWILSLFGKEFVESSDAMRLLLTTFFISSLTGNVINMLYMTGCQRDVALVMGKMALFNLVLSFVLIPLFGYMGAAISSGTTLIILHSTLTIILYRRVGIISLPFKIGKS